MPGATPYVLVEERSVGGNTSKGRRTFQVVLSIVTMVLSCILFVHGVLSLITTHTNPYNQGIQYSFSRGVQFERHTANFTMRVLSAYFMIFALLFICVEVKSTTILTAFAGMVSPLGRGIVYLLCGLLVFGTVGNWGLIFGSLWIINGIVHIIFGARNCRNFYDEGTIDNGSATVTRTPVSSSETYESTPGEKNFCRSCGAALRPSDTYCPDCSAAV